MYLLLQGTRTQRPDSRDSVFFDTHSVTQPPYTLHISMASYGETLGVAEIRRITMQLEQEPPVALHDENDAVIALTFEPWLEHAVSAGTDISLGDRLSFVDGQSVTIDVQFTLPGLDGVQSIRTVFRGKRAEQETPKLETIMQGS